MWCADCPKKAVAAVNVRASTNVKRDSSVQVLVVGRELPAVVELVALVKLDRERVHPAQQIEQRGRS
jgi:hypothetical protein